MSSSLAFAGSLLGDWAYATAVTVWAFSEGGATAVGVFTAVRFLSVAVSGPLGALVADRVPRRAFMLVTDAVRGVLVAVAALTIGFDGPAALVYVLATAWAIVGAPFRSAQAGLIPRLVTTPEELTSSNAVAANLENVVVFLGPAIGGTLVALVDVQIVFWFNVVSYGWSLAMVVGVSVPAATSRVGAGGADSGTDSGASEGESFLREVSAGFRVVARHRDLRAVAGLAAAQGLLWGRSASLWCSSRSAPCTPARPGWATSTRSWGSAPYWAASSSWAARAGAGWARTWSWACWAGRSR